MYGKIFESMYKGTLYGQWEAIVTFQQLIVLCDSDGAVDMTPPAIAATTSIPLEIIEKGLSALQETDPYSRSTKEDGRRLVLIDPDRPWGWKIVNYEYYRNLASREDKKEKDRIRMAEKRNKINDVADSRKKSKKIEKVAYTNTNTLKEGDDSPDQKDFIWSEALKFEGVTRSLLGKLCKDHSEDALVKAILRTKEHAPADPKSFLIACLKQEDIDPAVERKAK